MIGRFAYSKKASVNGWAAGGKSTLAELGSLHLEFVYLSAIAGDRKYLQAVDSLA